MGFVGLARDETTHEPTPYMASLPDSLAGRSVLVLDPMLATGGSLLHSLQLLAARGSADVTVVCALAAPEGVARIADSGLARRLFTASVDEGLDATEVREALESDHYVDAVRRDLEEARMLGVTGVPFFVIDGRYGISGAQATEVFTRALAMASQV